MTLSRLHAIADRMITLPVFARAGLAWLAGSLMALTMAPTSWWPLLFPCLSLFFITLVGARTWRDAAFIGWAFGFGFFLFGLFWISNALLVPGNPFIWVWPLALVGLPMALALFTALSAWIIWRFADLKKWDGFAFFCAVMIAGEYARGHILTGFPWNLYGYAWAGTLPMAQIAALVGPYGLSLITLAWAALPGFLMVAKPERRIVIAASLSIIITMAALYGWGAMRLHTNPTQFAENAPIIRLIQPNIPQADKWDPEKTTLNLQKLIDGLTLNPPVTDRTVVAVWPETAISTRLMSIPDVRLAIASSMKLMGSNPLLLTGILIREGNETPSYGNSLVAFDPDLQVLARFDKAHLVPFGEYMPLQSILPITPLVQFSGFTPGPGPQTLTLPGFESAVPPFSPLVCYEIIFPGAVTDANHRPAWIVNVTNDGWYGNSPGPYQHLAQTMFRAIEEGLPIVRSANNGISAIIDPYGRILTRIPYDKPGSVDVILPTKSPETPFYVAWRYLPVIFLLILIILCCAIRCRL